MKNLLITLLTGVCIGVGNTVPSMLDIKIHDDQSVLDKIKLEVVAKDTDIPTPMIKFRTANGNDFSVTTSKGKVVYMENDWLHEEGASQKPLLTDFTFGKTSLREVRSAFGTNGFMHVNMQYHKTKTHLCMFNCFEVDSPGNEILVVITRVPLNAKVDESNVSDQLKVDALILADSKYLDKLWGKEKTKDPNYKKIKL